MKSLRSITGEDLKVSDGSEDDEPSNPMINFRREKRSNSSHPSLTEPEAKLARKGQGKPACLCHSGHVLMESRRGLCLDISVAQAEREQTLTMLSRVWDVHGLWPSTLGMDGGYVDGYFLAGLKSDGIVSHVPLPDGRRIRGDDAGAAARRRARQRKQNAATG